MTHLDVLLVLAISLFLCAWWQPRLPAREHTLWLASGLILASGLGDLLLLDRWQASLALAFAVLALLALALRHWRGSPATTRRLWLSGMLFNLLALLAVAALYLFPLMPLPTPTGPYAVGVRSFELVDRNRLGVMHAAADAPRRLLVRVWYPAVPATDAEPVPYFSAREAATTAHGMGSLLGFPPLLSHASQVRSNSYADAPLLNTGQALPVVFFSHGYTGFAWQNSVLMEALASHGYAVYAVQHTYDASPTVFANGDVAPMDPALLEAMSSSQGFSSAMTQGFTATSLDERLDGQLLNVEQNLADKARIALLSAPTWLADRLFVHDRLQAGQVPDAVNEVVAASDFQRTGEMGMSYGGSVSGAVCMVDSRCAAMANLDGGDFHFTPFGEDLPVPLLMLHSDIDLFYSYFKVDPAGGARSFNDFSYERFEQAGLRSDIYRLQLKGAAHNGLTDLTWLMRRPLAESLLGGTPTAIMLEVPNDFVVGFFDRHLRGLANDFPIPQYSRHQGWALPYDNSHVRRWWLGKSDDERQAIDQRIAHLKDEIRAQRLMP